MPGVAQAVPPSQDPIKGFFEALDKRGQEPTFGEDSGTLRFDVSDGQRWYVAIDKGHVSVSHANKKAETVVRVERPVLEALVSGRMNPFAALLRGAVPAEGNPHVLMVFQRALPSPPGQKGRVPPISSAQVMAETQGAAQ
jgi:putative sterol carrier protein